MRSTLKKSCIILLSIVVGCLAIVGGVNYWVDPYNEFGRNHIGLYFSSSRQAKTQITKYPHDALLLGSSMVEYIDPADICCYQFYNASFYSAYPEEIFFYLQKYAHQERLVVIGFNFFMFNEHKDPLRQWTQWPDHFNPPMEYVFGYQVWQDSLTALNNFHKGLQPSYYPDGHRVFQGLFHGEKFNQDLHDQIVAGIKSRDFYNFLFSEQRMDYVVRIKQLLQTRGIKTVYFINPLQEEVHRLINDLGLSVRYHQWRERMKQLLPDVVDLSESFLQEQYYTPNDIYHYRPEVGAFFINQMLKSL